MRVAIVAVLFAGCGRYGFEQLPRPDGIPGPDGIPQGNGPPPCTDSHDEDGDGVVDSCDVCPHIANPDQADADNDGVGNLCDPDPTHPNEHIAFFDPFVVQRPEWGFTGPVPVYIGDALQFDDAANNTTNAVLPVVPMRDVIEVGGRVTANGANNRKLVLMADDPGPGFYYCELFDSLTTMQFALTVTVDGVTYSSPDNSLGQHPLATGPLIMRFEHSPPDMSCQTTYPVDKQLSAPIPTQIQPATFVMEVSNVTFEADYFIQIHSD